MRRTALCPCGIRFPVAEWQIKSGKGKYCSKPCLYKFRQRPSGLTYEIKVENAGWFKLGQRPSPSTEFQVGEVPHNFKGDQVGYDALHDWVEKHKQDPGKCEHCGESERLQWANKSHEYKRDLEDWLRLCSGCHGQYDRGHKGAMRIKFPEYADKRRDQKRRLTT